MAVPERMAKQEPKGVQAFQDLGDQRAWLDQKVWLEQRVSKAQRVPSVLPDHEARRVKWAPLVPWVCEAFKDPRVKPACKVNLECPDKTVRMVNGEDRDQKAL